MTHEVFDDSSRRNVSRAAVVALGNTNGTERKISWVGEFCSLCVL